MDMHGASGINSSHFIVVGGPGAYVGMSSTDVTINPVRLNRVIVGEGSPALLLS